MPHAPSSRVYPDLQAVIFDWSGTTVDCGCLAPTQAFIEAFAEEGVYITQDEVARPMGMDRREHIVALMAMPRVHTLWLSTFDEPADQDDIDRLHAKVEARLLRSIDNFSTPIRGVPEAVQVMRERGLRIGSCTGYARPAAERMAQIAAEHGFRPDVMVCASDVPCARPAPDMCLKAMRELGVHDPARCVKIGDTVNDVLEGIRAGMWVIGLTLTGSLAGLSESDLSALSATERDALNDRVSLTLLEAGAHLTCPDVPSCMRVLHSLASRD